jgi:hypothetical protein
MLARANLPIFKAGQSQLADFESQPEPTRRFESRPEPISPVFKSFSR